ncbi:sigma-70 family RNA polymerase sigma factor [uncultured Tenacibaculum sp.]|uniref:sigma-70 family RNA polymerase sigma factor n=1 Tax=uncultured Tenacibaculum sp. TaxID=174713 RepID=UPI002603C822|nr:sigma-70 family RNA polymerase sigma factor [uncultured Tenacibaculum sp.]
MKKECCNINEIIEEFYSYLKSYIFKKVKDKNISEDLVQEVMIKLVESHQKATEIKNIKAWLFQVSRNTIYDYYQKNKIEFDLDLDWKLEDTSETEFSKLVVTDYILPMILLLPEEYSIPLKLSDIDKVPQKEIAKQLNLGVSATKMRIQRARLKLRELFVECCEITYDKNGNFIECTIKPSCKPLQETQKDLIKKLEDPS